MTKCLDQQIQKLWVQMSFTTWSGTLRSSASFQNAQLKDYGELTVQLTCTDSTIYSPK